MNFSFDAGRRNRYFSQALKTPNSPSPKSGPDMRSVSWERKNDDPHGAVLNAQPDEWRMPRDCRESNARCMRTHMKKVSDKENQYKPWS
ncbi:MAG: hypothetical protein ACJASC_002341 [Limimaricola cinnabarinus]|jgi:hypothetical protein